MIRLAFVIDTIVKPTAGTEQQLLLLLRHLDRSRFDPVLCVLQSSKWLEEEFDLCPVHHIGVRSFKHLGSVWAIFRFVRFLKTEKVSIVYSFPRDGAMVGILSGKLAKVRLNIAARRNQGYWMTPLDKRLTKLLNQWTDIIITNSCDTRDWIVNMENVSPKKIKVVYNALEAENFLAIVEDSLANYRAIMGIPTAAPVIGAVANLRPVKALDIFLGAAQVVLQHVPGTYVVLVGDGDELQNLKQLAGELGIADQVLFLGRRQDVPAILTMLDIGVLSSRSESFSNALIEYLAAGLPVVCTDVGGAREAVDDGVNGYLVKPGNSFVMAEKIIHLLQNGDLVYMGKASQRKAKELFSLSVMISRYEEVFSTAADCCLCT